MDGRVDFAQSRTITPTLIVCIIIIINIHLTKVVLTEFEHLEMEKKLKKIHVNKNLIVKKIN